MTNDAYCRDKRQQRLTDYYEDKHMSTNNTATPKPFKARPSNGPDRDKNGKQGTLQNPTPPKQVKK